MSLGWSVTSPTLRSVRRSSELSGPTLVNTSNVVLKAAVMPEWRKFFEAEDSDLWPAGPTCHGSVFFHLNGCPKCLAFGSGRPRAQKRPNQTTISPGKRASRQWRWRRTLKGCCYKVRWIDKPLAHGEGSAISLNFYAKVSLTISSLFCQRAFALSGSSA